MNRIYALIGLILWMLVVTVGCVKPAAVGSISENERAAVVAGLVMGMDLSMALTGAPPFDKQKYIQLQIGFGTIIQDCQSIQCVTDRLIAFREKVRLSVVPPQQYPEILR